MSIVSDSNLISLRIVVDGVNTRNLIVANSINKQFLRLVLLRAFNPTVIPYCCSKFPVALAVEILYNLLSKGDSCS